MKKSVDPHLGAALDALRVLVNRLPANEQLFLDNDTLQDATLMRLQVAGEQLVKVRDNFPEYYEKYHTESWFKLIGLRNIIAHGYLEIDMQKVWQIASTDIPAFIKELQKLAPR